jgi:hypothetical protein
MCLGNPEAVSTDPVALRAGAGPFKLLRNRICLGEVQHMGASFPGQHEAIIDQDTWDRVHTFVDWRKQGPRKRITQHSALSVTHRPAQPNITPMYPGIHQAGEVDEGPNLPTAPLNTLLGFDLETYQIPLDTLMPSKRIPDGVMSTRKYKQVIPSIHEIGLIEPLSVIQHDPAKSEFILLDGHLRVLALKDLGVHEAPCLLAKDDETYTYNYRINRLSTIKEHYMIRRAIDRGVSKEHLARAFGVNLSSINRRINLLEGICPEAIARLQDKQFTPDVTRVLRNMKAARQVEVVDNTITVAYALLKATPPEQRTDFKPTERDQATGTDRTDCQTRKGNEPGPDPVQGTR